MYLDTPSFNDCYEMPSANLCWCISFAHLYRSEYMLAGRVLGLRERQEITLDRKNSTADKTVILA